MDTTRPPGILQQRTVLVTGPSGAGRSTAINALEDAGYEAIDNLPMSLLPRLLTGPAHSHPLALGIDARNREFSTDAVLSCIEDLASRAPLDFDVLYLDSSDSVLLRFPTNAACRARRIWSLIAGFCKIPTGKTICAR